MRQSAKVVCAFGALLGVAVVAFACGTSGVGAGNGDTNGVLGSVGDTCTADMEGQSRACHKTISQHDGILDCFEGQQTCNAGKWSECGATGGGAITTSGYRGGPAASAGDLHTLNAPLSSPTGTSGICAQDPCDPGCRAYNEDAGAPVCVVTAQLPYGAAYSGRGQSALTSSNNAVRTNPPNALCHGSNASCTATPNQANCDWCQFDQICVGGFCTQHASNANVPPTANCGGSGVDFTVEYPCQDRAGFGHVPVCNRGSAAATSGILKIGFWDKALPQQTGANTSTTAGGGPASCAPSTNPPTKGTWSVDLSITNIPPGACVDLNDCSVAGVSRISCGAGLDDFDHVDHAVQVNWDNSWVDGTGQPECNPCNNLTGGTGQSCKAGTVISSGGAGKDETGCTDTGTSVCGTPPTVCTAGLSAATGGSVVLTSNGLSGVPPGQQKFFWEDQQDIGRQCEHYGGPGIDVDKRCGYLYYACQGDARCEAGETAIWPNKDKNCHNWGAGERWPVSMCSGVDLTVGVGCLDALGNEAIPICNRGNTTWPGGPMPMAFSGPGGQLPPNPGTTSCSGSPAGTCMTVAPTCSPVLPAIPPGGCVTIDPVATGCGGSGFQYVLVNSNNSIPECTFVPENNGTGAQLGVRNQPGCANNWGASPNPGLIQSCGAAATAFVTTSFTFQYDAVCPPGYLPHWNKLTYDSVLPSDASGTSEVDFLVQAGPTAAGPWTPATAALIVEAANPSPPNSPATCGMSGPTLTCPPVNQTSGGTFCPTCPIDLYTALGAKPNANQEFVQLTIRLSPTPSSLFSPSVSDWALLYTCVSNE